MQHFFTILFVMELALLFTHELDAVRKQAWRMFIGLKNMEGKKAYHIFLLLHLPLYTAILLLLFSPSSHSGRYIVDGFLALHMLIHWGFRKHPGNQLNQGMSLVIINCAGLLAILHFILAAVFRYQI